MGKPEILETNPKCEEVTSFYPMFFVHFGGFYSRSIQLEIYENVLSFNPGILSLLLSTDPALSSFVRFLHEQQSFITINVK